MLAAVDSAGVFFNIRMVVNCFKKTTKYPSLQKAKALIICQFVCQVTILATITVEAWRGINFQPEAKFCCIVRMLSIFANILMGLNLIAISKRFTTHDTPIFLWKSANNTSQLEQERAELNMLKAPSPRSLLEEYKTSIAFCFGSLLLAFLALPWKSFQETGQRNVFYLLAFMLNYAGVGIVLPLQIIDFLNSCCEKENEMQEFIEVTCTL